jgi:carboxylate-amine ligase
MLLDPQTLDLSPCAPAALEALGGDTRFKPELPAAQVEILTAPSQSVAEAIGELARGRAELAERLAGMARPAAAGVHPFAAAEGELSRGERYDRIAAEYGVIARRQLVSSMQVHVAAGGAERSLQVYNSLRGLLPEVAALAANARFHEGRDTGMASIRPMIAGQLPRQGVPPPLKSWSAYAEELRWWSGPGSEVDARKWWWELRPHPGFGTLEVRVCDAQTSVLDAGALAAFVQALVAWLSERHAAGEPLPTPATWRIEENRWSAARHGVEGEMADLQSGDRMSTRERLRGLLDELGPTADRLGSAALLRRARDLVVENGALRQASIAQSEGPLGLAGWMANRFVDPLPDLGDGDSGSTPA